jgi:hypothetical protein
MGQHKTNQTVIKAKNEKLTPKENKLRKREIEILYEQLREPIYNSFNKASMDEFSYEKHR